MVSGKPGFYVGAGAPLGICDADIQSKFSTMLSAKVRQMVPLPVKMASE